MQRNAKLLYKKVTMNQVVRHAFRDYLLREGQVSEDLFQKFEYIVDLLLLNILDQIFIQHVIEPNLNDIQAALRFEMKQQIVPSHIDSLHYKKEGILKVFKLVNAIEANQEAKQAFAVLVNPKYHHKANCVEENNHYMRNIILRYLYTVYRQSNSLREFKEGAKVFETSRFLLPGYKCFYHDLRTHFMQRALGKELAIKLQQYSEGVSEETIRSCRSSDMTIFQLIPADLHATYFFKILQGIMRDLPSADKFKIKQFKYVIFMIFNVEAQALIAHKFNDKVRDSLEELGAGASATPREAQFEDEIQADSTEQVIREATLDTI